MTDDALISKPTATPISIAAISVALFIPLFAVLWLLISNYDSSVRNDYVEAQNKQLQTRLNSLINELDRSLHQLSNLPQVVAESRNVQDALQGRPSRYQMQDRVDQYLETIAGNLGVDMIWLMDTQGNTIATSNFRAPESLIGQNFAYRNYFRESIKGNLGHQFGIGVTTLVPGFYFSAPVQENGQVIGVVGLEIDVASLVKWVPLENMLVTDPNGLVIMSSNSDYLLNTMPDSRLQTMPRDDLLKEYQRAGFNPLHLQLSGIFGGHNLWTLGDDETSALLDRRPSDANDFEGIVYNRLNEFAAFDTQHKVHLLIAAIGSLLLAIAIASTLVYLRRSRAGERALKANQAKLEMINAQLEAMAGEDPLTGLYNRRKLNALLDDEWNRSKRYRRPLTLAILDLDFFKRINDTLGHGAGDAVLVHVAKLLGKNKRNSDILARLGGEEFIMVLPETRAEEAMILMERLRIMIQENPTPWQAESIPLTVSIGIANLNSEDRVSDMLSRADKALYEAKESGRNRIQRLDTECISESLRS
ncbi:diguanylate cyclase [Pokkaliibacter sp. CJK22405]|uniref:sensor domain-containing diguanylate cyclase n=1 Tax=Pokkaliibacter sp. CJK22405 TaxID=3384615 RepID=UPI003984DA88